MNYDVGTVVLDKWVVVQKIGEGGFGTVYKIKKDDSDDDATIGIFHSARDNTFSALKVIKIPQSESDLKYMRTELEDEESVSAYFEESVEKMSKEIKNMSALSSDGHIVCYEEHKIIPYQNEIGWDILIRMELLTPLQDYIADNQLTEKEIIKLGCDMCKALASCHKKNILHRDIKPGNIFISPSGSYKLGDFGVSRTIEGTRSGMSKVGTDGYMAPEVYKGSHYGFKSDIYSLGIVLYYLCNNKRFPFYPPYPEKIHFGDKEKALEQRMSGVPFPPPENASEGLSSVILKACEFNAENRYQTAEEMLAALENPGEVKEEARESSSPPPPPPPPSYQEKVMTQEKKYAKYYSMWKDWLIDLYGDSGTSKGIKFFRISVPPFFDVGPKIDQEIFELAKKYIAAGDNISSEDVLALVITKSCVLTPSYRFDFNYEPIFGKHGIIICTDKIYISTYKIGDNYDIVNYSIKYSEIKSLSVEQSPNKKKSFLVISLYSGNEIRAFFHHSWKADEFIKYLKQFLSIIK